MFWFGPVPVSWKQKEEVIHWRFVFLFSSLSSTSSILSFIPLFCTFSLIWCLPTSLPHRCILIKEPRVDIKKEKNWPLETTEKKKKLNKTKEKSK